VLQGRKEKLIELRKEGKTFQYIQCPLKCTANMGYNAINYEPKPEKRYAIRKTKEHFLKSEADIKRGILLCFFKKYF